MKDIQSLMEGMNLYLLETMAEIARRDVSEACIRFGITKEVAEELSVCPSPTLLQIARSPRCVWKIEDDELCRSLRGVRRAHMSPQIHRCIIELTLMNGTGDIHDPHHSP